MIYKSLTNWLNANRIYIPKCFKNWISHFQTQKKCFNFDLKLKLTGKRLSVGKLFINCKLPPIFNNWFTFSGSTHNYETSYVVAVLYFEFFFLFLKKVFIKGNLPWFWLCYMGIAFWLITLVVFIRCKLFFCCFFIDI